MMNIFRYILQVALLSILILPPGILHAQNKPIGYWRAHLPYNTALGVATDGISAYAISQESFFTYNNSTGAEEPYSKVDGMSDVGMQCIAYDNATSTTVLAYSDANIDLFKDNTFYNVPDLKIKTVAGIKTINQIYIENGTAYFSTSLGVLVLDLQSRLITETYQFIVNNQVLPIQGFTGSGNYFYAITPSGLYRADKSNPELQNFAVWQQISTDNFNTLANVAGKLFLATSDSLFVLNNDNTLSFLYNTGVNITINHIDAGNNDLWISTYGGPNYNGFVKKMDTGYQITDSFLCPGRAVQVAELLDGSVFVADVYNGLEKRTGANQVSYEYPPGPSDPNSDDIYAYNNDVWIAHGGHTDNFFFDNNGNGISHYTASGTQDIWKLYKKPEYIPFEDSNMVDFMAITKNPATGIIYAGSFLSGLFILNPDTSYTILNRNSIFDPSISYGSGARQVVGLAIDQQKNLWVSTMYSTPHQIYAMDPSGNWYAFRLASPNIYGGQVVIDDNGQVWTVDDYGGGVSVYNTNGTLSDPSDDATAHLVSGVGYGNLPSNNVFCIAKDQDDNIWIGTDNGIGIVSCAANYTSEPCDANIPIVQYDQFAGYLFAGYNVRTIAVDGANRKWVGTDNGVWLLSPDASQIIYQFTVDNSPLPSNSIEKITIDPVTGDVYIGTTQGLMCYRSTATDGGTTNSNVLVFPDPVPSGYAGTIAIKGLVANADVRITDISGQLVYKTTALGGQAVWNGMDYTGHRPQSGVYLIFATNTDGTQTYVGKMVFMN